MSSPFGHSIAGYIVASYESKTLKVRNVRELILYMFIANVPDLDFIPGALIGKPNLFHHGISHSLGAAVLFSMVASFLIGRKESHYLRTFLIGISLYGSHLFLDYISFDGRPPFGIPIFWPLSNEYFIFPYPILPPIMHSELDHATIGQFLDGLFSIHNLYVVFMELAVFIPILLISISLKLYRKKQYELKSIAK
jgi:inner membrane protein